MIRLNLATDYALRSLLYLACRPEEQASTREIAGFYGISVDHVSKVTQALSRSGYVRSGRGRGGGLQLGRPAEEITVGEIVELFEGPIALLECVASENVCVIQPHCRLRGVLDRAGERLIRELKQVTLAELVAPPARELIRSTPPAVAPGSPS